MSLRPIIPPVSNRSGLPVPLRRLARSILLRTSLHENVVAGEGLRVGRGVTVSSPHGLRLGNWVAIGPRTTIQVDGSIGDFCLIGMNVQVCGRRDHAFDRIGTPILMSTWVGDRPQISTDSVHIGTDVWIGGHSTIIGGTTIGDGAIVGASSVVTRDVPPFHIVVGSPARSIGVRFDSSTDQEMHLLELKNLSRRMLDKGR